MKNNTILVFCLCAVLGIDSAAQSVEQAAYFQSVKAPDVTMVLPNFPERGSEEWVVDSVWYEKGKEIRPTDRGRLAVADADLSINYFLSRISPIIGLKLSRESYPEFTSLLESTINYSRSTITYAKKYYSRHRPYQEFKESTPVPQKERADDFSSYPSGHSLRGWVTAMLMTAIDPQHAEEYFKMGYEFGQSRVIVGFHYQSDVEAGRLCASMAFANLCSEPSFPKHLEKARKELGF